MPLEVASIRQRVKQRLAQVKRAAAARRDEVAAAERAWAPFLTTIAIPTLTTVAQALSAEGYPYRVTTPADMVRLVSERSSHTYFELRLDTSGPTPQVVAEISRERGKRVLAEDRPIAEGAAIGRLSDEHLLSCVLDAIGDLIER